MRLSEWSLVNLIGVGPIHSNQTPGMWMRLQFSADGRCCGCGGSGLSWVGRRRPGERTRPIHSAATGQRYSPAHLHHLHTGESLDVVYRVGDTYIPVGSTKLNYFLRDHRTQDVKRVRSGGVRPAAFADGEAGTAEWRDRHRLRLPDAVEQ